VGGLGGGVCGGADVRGRAAAGPDGQRGRGITPCAWLPRSVAVIERGGGSFVFTSSAASIVAGETRFGYQVSKAGLHAVTRFIAGKYGRQGIRANAVLPFVLEGKVGSGAAEEIAESVVFLLSHRASIITGQLIHLDGGLFVPAPWPTPPADLDAAVVMDLSGGLAVEREHFVVERPADPDMRDSASFWVYDDAGVVSLPRIGIDAVASDWQNHQYQVNVAFADGRVYRIREKGRRHRPIGPSGQPSLLGAGPLEFGCPEPFRVLTATFDGTP
jgi:hypothetical protein